MFYFLLIEKKYGYFVEYWFGILCSVFGFKYMEFVVLFKIEYGLGYGYVNVLVVYYLVWS